MSASDAGAGLWAGWRVALVHAVHRSCRGAELRGGSGRAGLIDEASVRVIVSEPPRAVEDRKPAVRVFVDAHVRLDEVAAVALLGDLQHAALEADRVVVAHHALILDAEDVVEPAHKGHEGRALLGGR